ncbi:MAG: Maf family protein [Acholeplasmataceae bacterium]
MIILASRSPRRAKLLEDAGIEFRIIPSDIDETFSETLGPEEQAIEFAKQKALAVAKRYPNDVIVGADTIVYYENEMLGKPIDEEDAYRMLKLISGKSHVVYTGVAIIKGETSKVFASKAHVNMRKLSDLEIRKYIESKEPMDKAGAYAIQNEGLTLVESYDGDFFTIVGLPLKQLIHELKAFT